MMCEAVDLEVVLRVYSEGVIGEMLCSVSEGLDL